MVRRKAFIVLSVVVNGAPVDIVLLAIEEILQQNPDHKSLVKISTSKKW